MNIDFQIGGQYCFDYSIKRIVVCPSSKWCIDFTADAVGKGTGVNHT